MLFREKFFRKERLVMRHYSLFVSVVGLTGIIFWVLEGIGLVHPTDHEALLAIHLATVIFLVIGGLSFFFGNQIDRLYDEAFRKNNEGKKEV